MFIKKSPIDLREIKQSAIKTVSWITALSNLNEYVYVSESFDSVVTVNFTYFY